MEKLNNNLPSSSVLFVLIFCQLIYVKGQISTPCTASMMSSFSPCFGYLSSRNGGSLTSACCGSLKSITSKSMDCACLIVTGNVPLPSFVSQALAISLPKACGTSVPLQCEASSVSLPPPGPVLFVPPPPAATSQSPALPSPNVSPVGSSPLSPTASIALALVTAPMPAQAPSELLPPTPFLVGDAPDTTPQIRPVLTPSTSASSPFHAHAPHVIFTFIGFVFLKFM